MLATLQQNQVAAYSTLMSPYPRQLKVHGHTSIKMRYALKFVSYGSNNDVSFIIKRKVFMSILLYAMLWVVAEQ